MLDIMAEARLISEEFGVVLAGGEAPGFSGDTGLYCLEPAASEGSCWLDGDGLGFEGGDAKASSASLSVTLWLMISLGLGGEGTEVGSSKLNMAP